MSKDCEFKELLENIIKRPAMYTGTPYLNDAMLYLRGYLDGSHQVWDHNYDLRKHLFNCASVSINNRVSLNGFSLFIRTYGLKDGTFKVFSQFIESNPLTMKRMELGSSIQYSIHDCRIKIQNYLQEYSSIVDYLVNNTKIKRENITVYIQQDKYFKQVLVFENIGLNLQAFNNFNKYELHALVDFISGAGEMLNAHEIIISSEGQIINPLNDKINDYLIHNRDGLCDVDEGCFFYNFKKFSKNIMLFDFLIDT